MFRLVPVISGIVGLCTLSSFCATYSVEALPPFGNIQSLVITDINDSGWVTGYYQDGKYFKSIMWNNQQWTVIPGFSTKSTFAQGLNNSGTVVGQGDLPTLFFNGFSFQSGILTNETPANRLGAVYGINDSGVICGYAYFNGIGTRAFTKSGGAFHVLGTLGGSGSFGNAINNSNQVVGRSTTAAGITAAFLSDNTGIMSIAPAGALWSSAEAVNDFGFAVGSYKNGQGYRGFFYDGYESFDVGMVAGAQELWLTDINNDGTAVGYGYIDENHFVAVKYEQGNLIDLSTLIDPSNQIQLGAAFVINNLGWIAVLASFDGINGVIVILKPLPPEQITR